MRTPSTAFPALSQNVNIGQNGTLVPRGNASPVSVGKNGTMIPRLNTSDVFDLGKHDFGKHHKKPSPTPSPSPSPSPSSDEPTLMSGDSSSVSYEQATGTLFGPNGPNYDDAVQGPTIGDCYFISALAETALQSPDTIKNMIQDNGNGTYTVTFHDTNNNNAPVKITIDGELPEADTNTNNGLNPPGTPYYASSRNTSVLWPALIEKAYAQWKGGYDAIGNGGDPAQALQEITGKSAQDESLTTSNEKQMFSEISSDLSSGQEVEAGTKSDDPDWHTTGIAADHAYAVIGVKTDSDGTEEVELRNPWGQVDPANPTGGGNGIFYLSMAQFAKYYDDVATTSGTASATSTS